HLSKIITVRRAGAQGPGAVIDRVVSCALTYNLERHVRVCSVLDHAARHEASDVDGITLKFWGHRPDHRPARPVRLGDNGIIWHIDPVAIETDAIMPVLRFPVGIGYG